MPIKFNTHLTGTHILSADFLLNTLFFYSEQQNVNELLYGMDLISSINNTFLDEILVGVVIRDNDAVVSSIWLKSKSEFLELIDPFSIDMSIWDFEENEPKRKSTISILDIYIFFLI